MNFDVPDMMFSRKVCKSMFYLVVVPYCASKFMTVVLGFRSILTVGK